MVLGSSVYDNSPSMGIDKDFTGTRIRFLAGDDDTWFPPNPSALQLQQIAYKYKLTKVQEFPQMLKGNHADIIKND